MKTLTRLVVFISGGTFMHTGTVKWFSSAKGFGFICCEYIEGDVFVHQRDILSDGYRFLRPKQTVVFELEMNERGTIAKSVKLAEPETV